MKIINALLVVLSVGIIGSAVAENQNAENVVCIEGNCGNMVNKNYFEQVQSSRDEFLKFKKNIKGGKKERFTRKNKRQINLTKTLIPMSDRTLTPMSDRTLTPMSDRTLTPMSGRTLIPIGSLKSSTLMQTNTIVRPTTTPVPNSALSSISNDQKQEILNEAANNLSALDLIRNAQNAQNDKDTQSLLEQFKNSQSQRLMIPNNTNNEESNLPTDQNNSDTEENNLPTDENNTESNNEENKESIKVEHEQDSSRFGKLISGSQSEKIMNGENDKLSNDENVKLSIHMQMLTKPSIDIITNHEIITTPIIIPTQTIEIPTTTVTLARVTTTPRAKLGAIQNRLEYTTNNTGAQENPGVNEGTITDVDVEGKVTGPDVKSHSEIEKQAQEAMIQKIAQNTMIAQNSTTQEVLSLLS